MITTIVTVTVPALVSIIGFILTYRLTTQSFRDELSKEKTSIHLKEMATVPYDILTLFDKIVRSSHSKKPVNDLTQEMQNLFSRIYAYGSSEGIRILAAMQRENYLATNAGAAPDSYRQMAFYVLLSTQVKYDTTGILVSPSHWFELRLTDYDQMKEGIVQANNHLVIELGLDTGLLIRS